MTQTTTTTKNVIPELEKSLVNCVRSGRYTHTGQMFKLARWYLDMTQKEVAKEVGISYQQYQKYEYGILYPRKENRKKLCSVLRFSPRLLKLCHLENMPLE